VLDPSADHPGAALFAHLPGAAAAAGARAAALRAGELGARLGASAPLALPPGRPAAALLQPDAGVLLAGEAAGAARALAARAGVQVKVRGRARGGGRGRPGRAMRQTHADGSRWKALRAL
jgi:hypothetical protein